MRPQLVTPSLSLMDSSTTILRPQPPPPPQLQPPFFAFTPASPPDDPTAGSALLPPPPLPFAPPLQVFPFGSRSNPIVDNFIPPPFADSPRSVDLSPLEFIIALMAVITIPALIYAFIFAIRCPTRRPRESRRRSSRENRERSAAQGGEPSIAGVKYQKEAHLKDMGTECPVCLSAFADGEEIKQLSLCKHSFHAACIDMWLSDHSNCPICRADVSVKRPNSAGGISGRERDLDLEQGLPGAASLV